MNNKQFTSNIYLIATMGIIVGLILGFLIFNESDKKDMSGNTDNTSTSMPKKDMHTKIEVDKTKPVPTIKLVATADSKDGYNLNFITENYTLSPEQVGKDPVANTGHMHVFVNGEKVARPYGNWYHLSSSLLKEGENSIEVTLNANDHSEWVLDGEHISGMVKVQK